MANKKFTKTQLETLRKFHYRPFDKDTKAVADDGYADSVIVNRGFVFEYDYIPFDYPEDETHKEFDEFEDLVKFLES